MGPTTTEMGLTEEEVNPDQDLAEKARIIKEADIPGFNQEDFRPKQEVFLSLAGLKPVSMLGIPLEATEDFKKLMDQLGLVSSSAEGNPGKTEMFFVSKDQNFVDQYKRAIEQKTDLGILLGYPESATKAFDNTRSMDFEEQRKLVLDATEVDIQHAPFFVFSKNNYQEELAILKEWYKKLKEYNLDK